MHASALIADRDWSSGGQLERLVSRLPWIRSASRLDDGRAALAEIRSDRPDLVFLDARLPGIDGIQLAALLVNEPPAAVVIVTDNDRELLRVLELARIDHLVRPIEPARFESVMERVRGDLEHRRHDLQLRLADLLEALGQRPAFSDRLAVREGQRIVIVAIDEIDWIESAANYVKLHLRDEVLKTRCTLASLASQLDPSRFLRIHRSIIVNAEQIKQITPWSHGAVVVLRDGTRLNLSRGCRDSIDRFLERYRAWPRRAVRPVPPRRPFVPAIPDLVPEAQTQAEPDRS